MILTRDRTINTRATVGHSELRNSGVLSFTSSHYVRDVASEQNNNYNKKKKTFFCSCVWFRRADPKGRENLVLPLLIMGILSVIGGITGLRLPETLHYKLPQTVEEGEEFGKNWTMADCINCVPKR